jgi:DNA-binding beta-propeller fold protein YncE
MVTVPGKPFDVVATADGRWAFVSLGTNTVEVLRTGSFTPAAVRTIHLSKASPAAGALGEALTGDGRYLLVASGTGAVVISVPRAEQGSVDPVLGTLSSSPGNAGGAIEVTVSPDDQFAFVTLEDSADAAVFNLGRALAHGFGAADFVGDIPLGLAPVGMALSPDGHWLYATSEVTSRTSASPQSQTHGTLTVINLRTAETHPVASVVATVAAGCQPVRVITTADGTEIWVTARASDALLCFSTAALRTDPAHALIARVQVGEAPVGLVLVDNDKRIVVADSNRFTANGAQANLGVVNVATALAGKPAMTGFISAGRFPRQFALESDGTTLLATNFASGQLEAVNVADLP